MVHRRRGRRTWRRTLLLIGVPFFLLGGILVLLAGRPWWIRHPPAPDQPRAVFVTEYGRHSRLAMQIDDERIVEYSFGDWRYYAMGENSLWRGAVALTTPTDSGLGRRTLPLADDESAVVHSTGAERAVRIEVETDLLDDLLADLDARYRSNIGTEIHAPTGLTFVRDDSTYHLFHNSNHQTAAWLRQLGCERSGFPILSNFRLISPDEADAGRVALRHQNHRR